MPEARQLADEMREEVGERQLLIVIPAKAGIAFGKRLRVRPGATKGEDIAGHRDDKPRLQIIRRKQDQLHTFRIGYQHRQRDLAHALVLPFALGGLHPPGADQPAQPAIGSAVLGVGEEGEPLDRLDPAADHRAQFERLGFGVEPHHPGHRIDVRDPDGVITPLIGRQNEVNSVRSPAQEAEATHQPQFDKGCVQGRRNPVGIKLKRALVRGERGVGHQSALSASTMRGRTIARSASMPFPQRESFFAVPEESQEASYLAASARISNFRRSVGMGICSVYVPKLHCASVFFATALSANWQQGKPA